MVYLPTLNITLFNHKNGLNYQHLAIWTSSHDDQTLLISVTGSLF